MFQMKKHFYFLVAAAILTSSCISNSYYQVYKVSSEDKRISQDNSKYIVYEDDYCKILYNLWGNGGNVGFMFYNKTNDIIFIDLSESFFVKNYSAYDYYRNRTFAEREYAEQTSTGSSQIANAAIATSQYLLTGNASSNKLTVQNTRAKSQAVSYHEKPIICVPPMTHKTIHEYTFMPTLYGDCDFIKKSNVPKEGRHKSFSKGSSPYVFANVISYKVGNKEAKTIRINNEFYVSDITVYKKSSIIDYYDNKHCDGTVRRRIIFRSDIPAADKFYINF